MSRLRAPTGANARSCNISNINLRTRWHRYNFGAVFNPDRCPNSPKAQNFRWAKLGVVGGPKADIGSDQLELGFPVCQQRETRGVSNHPELSLFYLPSAVPAGSAAQ